MAHLLEKVERRLGEKLFIKGDRCIGPKCASVRRAYPPGAHGKKKRGGRGGGSEYSLLLRGKQKVRYLYNLDDKDIKRYSTKAEQKSGVFSSNFFIMLEKRLDNVVYRLGFTTSRRAARHAVKYGHITINGKAVNIPSYQVKKGESIGIKEGSSANGLFTDIEIRLKKYEPPVWLTLDGAKKSAVIAGQPDPNEGISTGIDFTKIKEFYSR